MTLCPNTRQIIRKIGSCCLANDIHHAKMRHSVMIGEFSPLAQKLCCDAFASREENINTVPQPNRRIQGTVQIRWLSQAGFVEKPAQNSRGRSDQCSRVCRTYINTISVGSLWPRLAVANTSVARRVKSYHEKMTEFILT